MKKQNIIELILSLIIFLFLYASISKLVEFKAFQEAMGRQKLPEWSKPILVWAVPLGEIVVCLFLLYEYMAELLRERFHIYRDFTQPIVGYGMRMIGLVGTLILMLMFTIYTGLAVFKILGKVPCSCGGIISKLKWPEHFALNLFFTIITIIAIWLSSHPRNKAEGKHYLGMNPMV